MLRRGTAPYLECSTKGDKRFSAFCAVVNGKSIEDQYQAAKVFEGGITGLGWREAKGKTPINREEVVKLYSSLWQQYINEHPELIPILVNSTGLSDMFGKEGSVCQADVLWRIRLDIINSQP